MSDIINAGESLYLSRASNIAQTLTQGGRRKALKRGPTLYNLEVKVPSQLLNGDTYYAIEEELLKLEYGLNTFYDSSISGVMKSGLIAKTRSSISGTPVVNGANQTGNTVTVSGLTGTVEPFDFVQFEGSTKVYQIMEGSTTTSLILNCPLVTSPADASVVVWGDNVNFNFCLKDQPGANYLPGNIVEYGTFMFEEVIQDT